MAEAAVQFDRINGPMARLERELEKSRQAIAEMAEEANRTRRFQAFEETLKNSRDYKITELQRCCKDIKSRLDTIEGDKTTFLGLPFKSFEPINRKLAELGTLIDAWTTRQRDEETAVVAVDPAARTVTIEGGMNYGQLCPVLHERGWAHIKWGRL